MSNCTAARPLVCLFDSGIGGLNLLAECVRRIPSADYAYFADNGNVPYGNLPPEKIGALVSAAFEGIAAINPDAAVVACNTVTAGCIAALRARYSFPVLGVQPALRQAFALGGSYLVLATDATRRSPSFSRLVKLYGGRAVIAPCACLAGDIEKFIFSERLPMLADGLPRGRFSSVVLGCTHYVFIEKWVASRYGCPVFDGMAGTADHLAKILGISDHFSGKGGNISFFGGDITKNRTIFEYLKQK